MSESWRELSESMRGARPVFIVGVQRSGTTALNYTLARHPSFLARGDLSPETRIFRRPALTRTIRGQVGDRARLYRYLLKNDAAAQRVESLVAAALAGREIPDTRIRQTARFLRFHLDHAVRLFFAVAQEVRGCVRLLEKTPIHVFFLEEMFATFPNARVIVCVRHPLGVLASYRKKIEVVTREHPGFDAAKRYPWLRMGANEFVAQNYSKRIAAARAWIERAPESCHLLRYEDLTGDPKAAIAGVCSFLGEPFTEAELFDAIPEERDVLGTPRARSRIARNEDRSHEFVTPDEVRVIEECAAAEIAWLGYARG